MFRLASKIALLTAALVLLAVSSAFAATHYASPNGMALDDTTCLEVLPCSIEEAVNSPLWAATGDEVVLMPGTYTITSQLTITKGLSVHGTGVPGVTVLNSNLTVPIEMNNAGASISQVTMNATNTGNIAAVNLTNGKISRSIINSQAPMGVNVLVGTITDTISIAHGSGSLGYRGAGIASSYPTGGLVADLKLRNVTSIGKGASYSDGLFVRSDGPGQVVVNAKSSIFLGGPNANSVDVSGNNVGGTSVLVITNSNFSSTAKVSGPASISITDPNTNGNQTGEVTFVDPASENYHLSHSTGYAIDLGTIDVNSGTKDFDGEDRVQGAAADIGADEVDNVPPAAPVITSTGLIVNSTLPVTGTAEPGTMVYVSNGALGICSSTATPSGTFACTGSVPALGPDVLSAFATDMGGNISATSTSVPFTVDRTSPVISLTAPKNRAAFASSPRVEFTVDELHPRVTECLVDDDARGYQPCTSGYRPPEPSHGLHTLYVRHTDLALNVAWATTTFFIDSHPPVAKKGKIKTKARRSTLRFAANEPAAFTCKLDRGKAKKCKSPYKT
ncbi:MAG: Ig-like domain-containing protein, partial [Solirubrobacterales bacterium]